MRRHVQTLGILWCAFGAYRLVGGLFGMFVLKAVSHNVGHSGWDFGGYGEYGPHWMAALLSVVAVYTLVMTALALLVGFSLLTLKPWGRILAVVVAILSLIKPLLGTALGIYTLWGLAPAISGAEYDALADRS